MKKIQRLIQLAFLTSILFTIWITAASAYETYSSGGTSGNRTGNCATCHGDFTASPYTSLADNTSWGDDLHDVHRDTMLGNDCDVCHTSGGRNPVFLDSSNGGTGLATISCLGCHGRTEGASGITGSGLRQHHWANNVTTCGAAGCHPGDSDPGGFMTVGENVRPPYYATPGTNHPNMPNDPCNPSGGENFAATSIGLDNDGDNTYDQGDTDCQTSVPDINLSPAILNFGDIGSGNSSVLASAVQNLGTADLNITAIARCAGTSTEFTWLPSAPFTVISGNSQALDVTYEPIDDGIDTGCLEIFSNDPDEPTMQLLLNKESSFLLFLPAIIQPNQNGGQ